jgi:hypothetical protein
VTHTFELTVAPWFSTDVCDPQSAPMLPPEMLWAPVVAEVNSAGIVPISYFVFGRRQPRSQPG